MEKGEEGARHLSKNTHIHHYSEGPAERLNGFLSDFLAMNDKPAEQKNWVNHKAKKTDSRIGQILNHKETVEYLSALRQFRPHFNNDAIFSAPFCMDVIHDVNGAVSRTSVYCK
jgi:hypothetical protein